ncbi:MAG: ABC transporter ATP-binding protein [Rubricoccaceae bacterium]
MTPSTPAGAAPPALAAEALTHRYGDTLALDSLSLEVHAGERLGLLGPNGSGKTTLFRAFCTLLRPSGGRVAVLGHDPTRAPAAVRRVLGVVFQHHALDGELTVRENLAVQAALSDVPRRERGTRVREALEAVGLAERAGDRVRTLSGGLARRADLARVLVHRPAVLLLDEPTTGLDPLARRAFWDALDRLRPDTTQLVATHLMEEAARCDRVAVLDGGRLVALGAPEALTDALGAAALYLRSREVAALRALLAARGLDVRSAGGALLVVHPRPAELLANLYADGVPLTEATIRRPSLEDVFVAATGRAFGPAEAELESQ